MTPRRPMRLAFPGAVAFIVLLVLWLLAFWLDPAAFGAAWLVAWWTGAGVIMGGQANAWLHDMTGGEWGLPIRPPLARAAAAVPWLAFAVIAIVVAMHWLYPWAQPGWQPASDHPRFQQWWLQPAFVGVRLIAYAVVWTLLIAGDRRRARPALPAGRPDRASGGQAPKPYAALSLIVYGVTASLAAVDLLMSLTPDWRSTGFGLVAITSQMKAGLAWSTFWAAPQASAQQRRDLGNLLLMYVLMWGYLAFVQFQIIWAENLPNEISWYVSRLQSPWVLLALVLVVGGFFVPLVVLLFRAVKDDAGRLRAIAGWLCVMAVLESVWVVLPSSELAGGHAAWMTPLAVACAAWLLIRHERRGSRWPRNRKEADNAATLA